jgi:hypothetical protein
MLSGTDTHVYTKVFHQDSQKSGSRNNALKLSSPSHVGAPRSDQSVKLMYRAATMGPTMKKSRPRSVGLMKTQAQMVSRRAPGLVPTPDLLVVAGGGAARVLMGSPPQLFQATGESLLASNQG